MGAVDLVTGGFPCQPFSSAGKRLGTEDDRHLWPDMLRVIRESRPRWIIGENVAGLLTWDGGLVLEMVLADLESAGYEAGAFVIPACALNAPHRRDRVWIAAHAIGSDARGTPRLVHSSKAKERVSERDEMGQPSEPSEVRDASDSTSAGGKRGSTTTHRREGHTEGRNAARAKDERRDWGDWYEAATELCTMDDGLPDGLARPRGWRNAALKGAGNSIVPQIPELIGRAILESA